MNLPPGHGQADRIADAIIQRVGKEIVLGLPLGLGKANHIVNALYARAAQDRTISLKIFTALTLGKPRPRRDLEKRFIGPIAERLFGGYPELAYAAAQIERRLPSNIEVNEFYFLAGTRLGNPVAQQSYISANYTHAMRYLIERGVNVVAQLVAKKSRDGEIRYSLSCNTDITLDLLAERAAGNARFVFAGQVNSDLPFMLGDADVPADTFEFMLDDPACDFPLFTPPTEPVTLTDYAAGMQAARLVPDGGTLQLGIGALGDAIAQSLVIRQTHNDDFTAALAKLDAGGPVPSPALHNEMPFTDGVHGVSEMFVEGFLALMRAGVLKRVVDGVLLHAGFFVGSGNFNRTLRELPEQQLRELRMIGISYVNELYGDEDAKRRARSNARFINNAMMATLLGAVVSDTLEGGQVVSGVGGQYNFVSQAFALKDARSIIVLRATRNKGGKVSSNIVWEYGQTTIPRHLRDIIVTEYGIADLRGKSDRDAIVAMVSIADSRFQDGLLRKAKDAGKVERDFELPGNVRGNTPDRISRALAPARERGHLPVFPLGTEFTTVEQRLIPALGALGTARPLQLARFALRGLTSTTTPDIAACLDRMQLEKPASVTERIMALVLRGALAEG